MQTSRFVSAALTTAIAFSMAPSAFAITPGEVLEMQKEYQAENLCEGKSDRERGRCISDSLKRIKSLRKLFSDALREDRKVWDAEHAHLGVSADYLKAVQEYGITMQARRKLFNEQQRVIEKAFFDKQKEARVTAPEQQTRPANPRMSTTSMEAAVKKCSSQRNDAAVRVCLRQQMRVANPNLRSTNPAFRRR